MTRHDAFNPGTIAGPCPLATASVCFQCATVQCKSTADTLTHEAHIVNVLLFAGVHMPADMLDCRLLHSQL